MKRLLLASLGAVLLLVPSGASATSIAVPVAPSGGRYLVGFDIESVEEKIDPETFRSTRYLGRISLFEWDPLAVTFRIGGSEIDVDSDVHGRPTTFEGRPKLALGAGAGYHLPLRMEGLGFFADAELLYTLSAGRTSFTTTIQSNTFHEEYENRYRWVEYQAGAGIRKALPFGGAHAGLLARAVDGKVWRETYQGEALVSSGSSDFSRELTFFLLGGIDFEFPGGFVLSVGGSARGSDDYTVALSIAEFSR
ncbi:MAG: hypothetical protein EHM19_05300 [Candidatus Latescibacterota bacterium]|nr:MAG: hypothetical protein EHM19_05300 [Candidatus Latescibacterota bacterium]